MPRPKAYSSGKRPKIVRGKITEIQEEILQNLAEDAQFGGRTKQFNKISSQFEKEFVSGSGGLRHGPTAIKFLKAYKEAYPSVYAIFEREATQWINVDRAVHMAKLGPKKKAKKK